MRLNSGTYQPRTYRRLHKADGLAGFGVCMGESDLWIWAERDLRAEAASALRRARNELCRYIRENPRFAHSLEPIRCTNGAPAIVWDMCRAGQAAGVGPMAAVAGAIAQQVAEELAQFSREVIVENGGDLYLVCHRERIVGIMAPGSCWDCRLGLRVRAPGGLSICTSSGTHGHSLSLGRANAATVIAASGALADAVATALGNRVVSEADIEPALEWLSTIDGIIGGVVVCGGAFGVWGQVELTTLAASSARGAGH